MVGAKRKADSSRSQEKDDNDLTSDRAAAATCWQQPRSGVCAGGGRLVQERRYGDTATSDTTDRPRRERAHAFLVSEFLGAPGGGPRRAQDSIKQYFEDCN